MLGVLLIAVGLNVVHRRNFAEYVGRRAFPARSAGTARNNNNQADNQAIILIDNCFKLGC